MYGKIIIISILISLLYTELTDYSSGGLIVPGYIAINLNSPNRVLATLIISLITFFVLNKMSNYLIIFGKRRFALSIGISVLITMLFSSLLFPIVKISIIGNIIPGILANEFLKEGIIKTLISLSIVVSLLVIIMMYFGVSVI